MVEDFKSMLAEGGKKNTVGRAEEVVNAVLADSARLDELYECIFDDDAWIRMRAIDALEKVCRVRPDWLKPYVDKLLNEVAVIDQPSIQWHLPQIFTEVELSASQLSRAVELMKCNISTLDVDWIVSANTMTALVELAKHNLVSVDEVIPLLEVQTEHHSKSVSKKAYNLLGNL